MPDYGFVALAFGVTWTVLAGYSAWAWTARARAARAWREALSEERASAEADAP